MKKISLKDDRVIVVIGSGASGGTVVENLCKSGLDVVLIEAGKFIQAKEFYQDENAAFNQLAWKDKRISSGDWNITKDNPNYPAWLCQAVGGTSIHWTGTALRMKDYEFNPLSTYGSVEGANLIDWPINLKDLEIYYDLAEKKMGVSGTNGLPQHPTINNFKIMYHGAVKAGYKEISKGRLAINSVEYDNRPPSNQDGFTISGDKIMSKWSTAYIEIPRALKTGHLDLRTSSRAIKIEIDKHGHAEGVVFVDKNGVLKKQLCSMVVLAANAIETPRILLNSHSKRFPNGLANGSNLVGKNFMRHMTSSVWSVFEKPVRMYRGEMMPGLVSDESYHNCKRNFVAGYYIQLLSLSLPAIASSIQPGLWGKDFSWAMDHYGNMAGLYGCGEDMPQLDNKITLSDENDLYGVPIAEVHYSDHPNDIKMRESSYLKMENIHKLSGAIKSYKTPPYPASHNMGTTRMSNDPSEGVTDKWGKTHEVSNIFIADGSCFSSSSAANPTLTIVALALRQSEKIKSILGK